LSPGRGFGRLTFVRCGAQQLQVSDNGVVGLHHEGVTQDLRG